MKNKTLLLTTTLALVLAPAVAAQTSPSQASGMASALAAGLSLDETNRNGPEDTLVKAPLNQTGAPGAFSGTAFSNIRDYSLAALFPVPGLASVIEIDAQSTGNDLIPGLVTHPTKGGCYPNLGAGPSWMVITVSFDNLAKGRPNSLIQERRNNTQGRTSPGSDIYSHYLLGSQGIAEALVNRTMVEQAAEQIAYPGEEDIDGLDFALGVKAHGQQTNPLLFFPNDDEFYFSLAPSCIDAVNQVTSNQFARDQGTPIPADMTTIYAVTWDSNQGSWLQPVVYHHASDLGLIKGVDDVDALAVNDTGIGPNDGVVIFSTAWRDGHGVSQLQGYDPNSGALGTLRNSNGRKITRRLGAIDDTDDIDAICIIDPEAGVLGTHLGVPTRLMKATKQFVGLSVTRGQVGGVKDNLIIQVSGWGGMSPIDCSVELKVAWPVPLGQPLSNVNWYSLAKQGRSATDEFVEWALPLQGNLPPLWNVALVAEISVGTVVVEQSLISQFDIY